jgi:hypothetical protein
MPFIVDVIGWLGAGAILLGYFLFSIGKIENGFRYQGINLAGALFLTFNALVNELWPFVILNAVWSVTAIFALSRLASKAHRDREVAPSAGTQI